MQVLKDSRAQEKYRKRKSMVEPAFAEIKERQGLKRFHRRGLLKVRLEFALHCVAFNIKRASRLEKRAFFCISYILLARKWGTLEYSLIIFYGFSS